MHSRQQEQQEDAVVVVCLMHLHCTALFRLNNQTGYLCCKHSQPFCRGVLYASWVAGVTGIQCVLLACMLKQQQCYAS